MTESKYKKNYWRDFAMYTFALLGVDEEPDAACFLF